MNGEEVIRVISQCAKSYSDNLLNRNLLFVYGSSVNAKFFEVVFLKNAFLHLTGVKTAKKIISPTVFFNKVLLRQIEVNDLIFDRMDLIERKLLVLPSLMSICTNAKMVGEYDSSRPILRTEVLAGGVKACMGFVKGGGGYYVPNTVLQEDLRNITKSPQQRVLAVFRKNMEQDKYQEITYLAKGVDLNNLNLPHDLNNKILLN